ncbi:MAG TPA: DUF5131 family protein [Mycobacterium sp.]|nr:DUF5131 family protein [Mycobacterium sp.]HUH68496.1 DUF5131 family protein [Mycobacterium sp.]
MSRHTDVLGLAMGDKTHISWTADEDGRRGATWNFVHGCERVSPGCTFCYIELQPPLRMTGMRFNGHQVGATTGVRLRPEVLTKPMHWRRPRKIFTNRLSDTFHDAIPSEVLAKAWAVMACCPDHTFQILTKRHGRMRSVLSRPDFRDEVDEEITQLMRAAKPPGRCWPVTLDRTTDDGWNIWGPAQWTLPWAWIGVTAEDQDWLERRWSALRATPAALRWLSCEPLLGPIRLCRCDGAAFEIKRHPFLVHPECPLHVAARRCQGQLGGCWRGVGADR